MPGGSCRKGGVGSDTHQPAIERNGEIEAVVDGLVEIEGNPLRGCDKIAPGNKSIGAA
jgi:hypothetical protein